jgi:hypothetical protein
MPVFVSVMSSKTPEAFRSSVTNCERMSGCPPMRPT